MKAGEASILDLYLFSETSSKNSIISLDNIGFECTVNEGIKLFFSFIAKNLVQERNLVLSIRLKLLYNILNNRNYRRKIKYFADFKIFRIISKIFKIIDVSKLEK